VRDEDDGSPGNQIPTILAGQLVRAGRYVEPITHYTVLATIEAAYGCHPAGRISRRPRPARLSVAVRLRLFTPL